MQRIMLSAKLHRVRATATELDYEGSVSIDADLMNAAGINEYEQVHVYNVANGQRFSSYAVTGPAGSGEVAILGAAARNVCINDLLIICTYAGLDEAEMKRHRPTRVYVDDGNRITHTDPPTEATTIAV